MRALKIFAVLQPTTNSITSHFVLCIPVNSFASFTAGSSILLPAVHWGEGDIEGSPSPPAVSVVSHTASHNHLIPPAAGQLVGASIDLGLYEEFKVSNASRLGEIAPWRIARLNQMRSNFAAESEFELRSIASGGDAITVTRNAEVKCADSHRQFKRYSLCLGTA